MLQNDAGAESAGPNDPRAPRMGLIAWTSHNVIVGSIFGTAGILLIPLQDRLHISRGMVSLCVPVLMVGSAVFSSIAGTLAARFSLRSLMAASGILLSLAWLILAYAHTYALVLLAYGLCLGPAMAVGGLVLPPTLVTRWFQRHRGLAIGLVHLPIVITVLPLAASWVMGKYGLTTLFVGLASFALVALIGGSLALIECPPGHESLNPRDAAATPTGFSVSQLLQIPQFWVLVMTVGGINAASACLSTHLAAMGAGWAYTQTSAAALISAMSLVGIGGSVIFGFIADKLGGARTLALIAFDEAILWSLLLLDLPYAARLVVVGLFGLHGAGAVPALSQAIVAAFGQASFSRAFGLALTGTLPLMFAGVFGFGMVFQVRGSYAAGMVALIVYFVIATILAVVAGRRAPSAAATALSTTA